VAKAVACKGAQKKILPYWGRSCHVCHVTFSIPLIEATGALYARLALKDVRMTRVGRGIKTEPSATNFER
jgi:hypothetical protein